jgi:PhzF family phenazine biosynthesis protein
MTTNRPFRLVDVFGAEDFRGNPVGIVHDSGDLDTDTMHLVTRWMNHSETAFLSAPSAPAADYGLRIFTLERELPFAGHPSLGACHAWLEAGGVPRTPGRIIQQCGAGLIELRQGDDGLAFVAPPLVREGPPTDEELDEALGLLGLDRSRIADAAWIDNGPGWLGILLHSAEEVLALRPSTSWPRRVDVGVVGLHEPGGEADVEVRAFFTGQASAIIEDPITGSLNASIAQWLIGSNRVGPSYVAAQGTAIGRAGRVQVRVGDDGAILIGGNTRTLVEGTIAVG